MRKDRWRVPPPQSIGAKIKGGNDRRGRCQRVKGAAVVGHEVGVHVAAATYRAPRLSLRLQDEDRPPRVDEQVRRDQSVRPRTDHDRINIHDPDLPTRLQLRQRKRYQGG
jgi:hypothetical protein